MSDEIFDKAKADLDKYGGGDEAVLKGIIKHLGIAVRSKDASLVSVSDPSELERVRESFLKKKLGLDSSDAELDGEIQKVAEEMKGDHNKQRTTFYYLLAKNLGRTGDFA